MIMVFWLFFLFGFSSLSEERYYCSGPWGFGIIDNHRIISTVTVTYLLFCGIKIDITLRTSDFLSYIKVITETRHDNWRISCSLSIPPPKKHHSFCHLYSYTFAKDIVIHQSFGLCMRTLDPQELENVIINYVSES